MLPTLLILQGENLVDRLVRKDISNEERDAIVEQLKQSDFALTAPGILVAMRDHVAATEPGMKPKPWMNDSHSHRAKVWYASGAIWRELFRGAGDPKKEEILLKLLSDHHDNYSRYVVLGSLGTHWGD